MTPQERRNLIRDIRYVEAEASRLHQEASTHLLMDGFQDARECLELAKQYEEQARCLRATLRRRCSW